MDNQEYMEIMERLDFIEFRQDLIFSGSELDRSIYEYRLTKKQYTKIMDLMDEYRRKVLKVDGPRKHKVKNSNGVYDSYKWIRKNKWLDIGRPLTEHEFYSIIRQINNLLAEVLLSGGDITLPHRLGTIELRKYDNKITVRDDKVIENLPIDWDRTLKLWSEDEEA